MSSSELLEILARKSNQALAGGGEQRLAKQRAAGKLSARERMDRLLDTGSFLKKENYHDYLKKSHHRHSDRRWRCPWSQSMH
jgi:acetyl-CoA carboxylase carboxyltransferase component